MKHLLIEILDNILEQDEELHYLIQCEQEVLIELTRDTSKACNTKEGDQYEGVNAVDSALIEVYKIDKTKPDQITPLYEDYTYNGDAEYVGSISWSNWDSGAERIEDYSCILEDKYRLHEITAKWEASYNNL